MKDLRPRDLFNLSFRQELRARLDSGPVVLLAPVGAGAEDLALAEVERAKHAVLLKPTVGSAPAEAISSTVAQVVHDIEPMGVSTFDGNDGRTRRALLALARRYGSKAALALDVARGGNSAGWTLADALGTTIHERPGTPVLVAITNAHRLPGSLLWELRDLANDGQARVLLTTHAEHAEGLLGAKAPLYGNATSVELPEPVTGDWARKLHMPRDSPEIQALLIHTRARAASTIEVAAFRELGMSVSLAWQRAINSRASEAENVLNLAATLNVYAPRLLIAIANEAAPYGAITGAPSQRVARALAKLRDVDLIERGTLRTWQIADPVLHGALLMCTSPYPPNRTGSSASP